MRRQARYEARRGELPDDGDAGDEAQQAEQKREPAEQRERAIVLEQRHDHASTFMPSENVLSLLSDPSGRSR